MQKANLSPETLRAKKRVHVAVSCVLLTVVLSTLLFLFPTGIMATCCVIFAGIFFCLAVSYQRAVLHVLLLTLGSLGICACFYVIATA